MIVEWLSLQQFDQAILMLQKEFAEKIQSNVGDKSYRAITVVCRYQLPPAEFVCCVQEVILSCAIG